MHKLAIVLKSFAIVLLLGVTAVAQALSSSVVDQNEAQKWRADLRFMADAMPKYHKNLFHTMTREQFQSAISELDKRIPNLARHQIIVEMARIVALVGDGHTNIAPTRDPKIGFHTFPIKLYYFDDGIYIRSATTEHADLLGSSLLAIDGKPIASVFDEVKKLIGRDNEMDLKFFAPLVMTMPEVLHAVGVTRHIDEASFVLLKEGKKLTVKLKPAGDVQLLPADTDLSWQSKSGWIDERGPAVTPLWLKDPQNKFWFEFLEKSRALYVQLNQIGNKDDESMESFCNRLLTFINSNQVEKLIVDLRLNRGGNGDFNRPILRTLIKADKVDQKGKLFVIIGRSTWSAAQFLVNNLEDYTNAIFVGEPSGGKPNSYGDSLRITLPNSGITVRVSTLWWQEDERDRRQWTAPDLAADMTSEDYRNNIDPALKIALEYVSPKSLSESLTDAMTANNPERVGEVFKQWRSSRINRYVDGELLLLRLGYRLLGKKQLREAIQIFTLMVHQYTSSSSGFGGLADAYVASGNNEMAIRNYQRAVKLDPTNRLAKESLDKLLPKQ